MKKIITLYQFEWEKNKTSILFFVAILILFLFCYELVSYCIVRNYEDVPSRPNMMSFDWQERVEKAKEQYEANPTPERLRYLNGAIKYNEMKEKVIEKERDLSKPCYYCLSLEDDYYQYAFEMENEWNGKITHIEELENALSGDFYDYLVYQELRQEDRLIELENREDSEYVINQYKTLYQENLDLVHYFKNKKDIKEWQMDLMAPYLSQVDIYIWNQEGYGSELEFSMDDVLKKEYQTYDNYIETMKKEIEGFKNARDLNFYRLYHDMEPTEYFKSGGQKSESMALQFMPIGMIFTFLLVIGLFGFPLFRERKRNLVNLVKTKDFTSHQIFASKFLYYSSILILFTFYFLVFFLIMCLIYRIPLDAMFLTIQGDSIIAFTFFHYLVENVVRLLAIFHIFLLLFLLLAGIQRNGLVPYIILLPIMILLYNLNSPTDPYQHFFFVDSSVDIAPRLLNTQYIGSNLPIYLLCIFLIACSLYLFNNFVWKKKW